MLLLIGFVSLVIMPLLVNKTTEAHFNWVMPYLRQVWCGVALVYVVYFLTTDTGKQLMIDIETDFGSKHPVMTLSAAILLGAILAPSYWWLPPWKRWLEFMKEAQGFTHTYSISVVVHGKLINTQAGQIRNLPEASAVACIACAATTYSRQQPE